MVRATEAQADVLDLRMTMAVNFDRNTVASLSRPSPRPALLVNSSAPLLRYPFHSLHLQHLGVSRVDAFDEEKDENRC